MGKIFGSGLQWVFFRMKELNVLLWCQISFLESAADHFEVGPEYSARLRPADMWRQAQQSPDIAGHNLCATLNYPLDCGTVLQGHA